MTIISERHKVVFVHQEKCGGTSVKRAWQEVARWGDFIIGGSILGELHQDYYRKAFNLNKHSSVTEIRSAIGPARFQSFETYALIRCPTEIVVSYFYFAKRVRDRMCNRQGWDPIQFQSLLKNRSRAIPQWMHDDPVVRLALDLEDLDDFCTQATRYFQPDFLSNKFCIDTELAIDHLIPLSEIGEIESRLNDRYGIGLTIGHENKSQISHQPPSNDILDMLRNRFESDIARFQLQSVYD